MGSKGQTARGNSRSVFDLCITVLGCGAVIALLTSYGVYSFLLLPETDNQEPVSVVADTASASVIVHDDRLISESGVQTAATHPSFDSTDATRESQLSTPFRESSNGVELAESVDNANAGDVNPVDESSVSLSVSDDSRLPDRSTNTAEVSQLPTGDSYIAGNLKLSTGQRLPARIVEAKLLRLLDSGRDSVVEYRSRQVRTDRRGNFSFRDLPVGDYQVSTASALGTSAASLDIRSTSSSAELVVSPIRLTTLTGLVTDANDVPLAGVTVSTTGANGAEGTTDTAGYIRLEVHLDVGQTNLNRLKFSAAGFLSSFLPIADLVPLKTSDRKAVRKFHQRMNATLDTGTLMGVVSDNNGIPLAGIALKLGSLSGDVRKNAKTDESGNFQFSGIPANGTYRLAALPSRDYLRQAITVSDLPVGDTRIDLTVQGQDSTATLRGQIVDANGVALPRFAFRVAIEGTGRKLPRESDSNGYFEISDLPAGNVSLQAAANTSFYMGGIALRPAEITEVRVPIDLGQHAFVGRVVDKNGEPVPGAVVRMDWESATEPRSLKARTSRQSVTDSEGLFRFAEIGEGQRRVKVRSKHKGFVKKSLSFPRQTNEVVLIRLKS